MATIQETVTRICSDMSRPEVELGAYVQNEILTAIRHYETRRFTFNERILTPVLDPAAMLVGVSQWTFNQLIQSQSQSVEDIFMIDLVKVTQGGTRQYTLTRDNWPRLFALDQLGTSTSIPDYYATFDKKMLVYPAINATLSCEIFAHVKLLTLLSQSGAPTTNAWLTDAEELIRNRATGMTLAKKLDEFEKAGLYRQMELDELTRLQREAHTVQSTGKLAANF